MPRTHRSRPPFRIRRSGEGARSDVQRVAGILREESVGGALLALAAAAALILANSPAGSWYVTLRDFSVGPSAVGLHLSLAEWAGEGLLAVFFFVAGLELKREFVSGDLRDPRRAAVPVAAAVGGMAVPALLYLLINRTDPTALVGWAIPTATDIAFALAVLAVVGRNLPAAIRTFLLTLAVVDDLLAITVIAIFYSDDLRVGYLLATAVPLAAFALVARRAPRWWWLLVPIAVVCWTLMHASGVHSTVAGVLMALTVPVSVRGPAGAMGPAGRLDHLLRPISAGIAVPVFGFLAAGVDVGGLAGLGDALRTRLVLGVVVGMVAGKVAGIFGSALLTSRLLRSPLSREIAWPDLLGLSVLGGVGFTVALLIGSLAFGGSPQRQQDVQIAVLTASLTAALLAALVLGVRSRAHRRRAGGRGRDAG